VSNVRSVGPLAVDICSVDLIGVSGRETVKWSPWYETIPPPPVGAVLDGWLTGDVADVPVPLTIAAQPEVRSSAMPAISAAVRRFTLIGPMLRR